MRHSWDPLQNLLYLLDVQFGKWMYQSLYPAFNDTVVKTLFVPIYLSDISDGPDSKTGTAVRVCSPQRLLPFDVMRKVGLVYRVLIF